MALTNDQITAQNFKDFYTEIRPYLNGNVPTFANTFSKSELYSTDETLIGKWVDNKPLYQKVIDATSYSLENKGSITIQTGLTNVDNLISIEGLIWHDGSQYWRGMPHVQDNSPDLNSTPFQFNKASGNIMVFTRNSTNASAFSLTYIILKYTKVGDSAISITDGNEYSTNEQVVGHWIDGKPLFQRTYITNLSLPLNNAQVNFGDISDLNMDYGTVTEIAFCEDD